MRKINIGIIGTGVGIRTHLPAFNAINNASVIGLSGSSPDRAKLLAKKVGIPKAYDGYTDLCADSEIDLVCVTSPNTFHHMHVLAAIKAGKAVLCEKPLAMNIEELKEIEDYCKNKDRLFLVNHQLRFNPYIIKIKELISKGKLGDVYNVRIHQQGTGFSNRNLNWMWSLDSQQGGGVRLAMGSHLIDLIRFIFRKDFAYIRSTLSSVVDERVDNNGVKHEVTGSAYFSLKGALKGLIDVELSATAAAFGDSRFDISIYGTEGEIQFSLDNKLKLATIDNIGLLQKVPLDIVFQDELDNKISIFSGSFRYFAPKIIEALESEESFVSSACTIADSIWQQKILDACLTSWKTGKEFIFEEAHYPQQNKVI